MLSKLKALIVEPNSKLITPYNKLYSSWQFLRINSTELAINSLENYCPHIVFISNSYKITKSIRLLEAIKNISILDLVPVIFVVDFSNHISYLPGTKWAGKIGIIHSLSSKNEIASTLSRVFNNK